MIDNRILILGGSGFIGHSLYKELHSYFDVYGTYCSNEVDFGENKVFFQYCSGDQHLTQLLEKIQPAFIISTIRGDFINQLDTHKELCEYVQNHHQCKLLFLSSVNVFDGKFELPSYENDKPLAISDYGKYKISIEKLLLSKIPAQSCILRLPMVLGVHSPRMNQLREAIKHQAVFEVYPNLIISLTTADKVAQQIHYIINKKLDGIFHLASKDMIHHEDLFREISTKISNRSPIFKSVYRSNDDSYLAILPKKNKLPKAYRISVSAVVDACTLNEEIETFKK